MGQAVADDEIYERYLARAIGEINELSDDIARCDRAPHTSHRPVVGSGHPLADIFLLKYAPVASELAEGVAFFGRVGQAVLKSVQRLSIDPLLLYGTNCVKCGDVTDEERRVACPVWLLRELHIVQPKLVVVMGADALEVLNGLGFPLARTLEPELGTVQKLTPTIDAVYVPPIEASLDDAASKRQFWAAFRVIGEWYEALPPY
jgi:uracil-DNA glycosylase family 4